MLLGAITSPEQQALVPQLDALVAVVLGYVDHALDHAAPGAGVGRHPHRRGGAAPPRPTPARPTSSSRGSSACRSTRSQVERGHAFVEGVIERPAGPTASNRLWQDARALPTPAEVDAPGLWLARLEYDA